jgi:hypothetical protein
MTAFRERLVEAASRHQRQPILFKFEPKETEELRKLADEQVGLLGDNVEELRQAVRAASGETVSVLEAADDAKRTDRAVRLTAEVCHVSRVAFVLVSTFSRDVHGDCDLRDRCASLQEEACRIALAFAESRALDGSGYAKARAALAKYAASMQRRVAMLRRPEC